MSDTKIAEREIVRLTARGAARLRRGHPWIMRGDLLPAAKSVVPTWMHSDVVNVADERGRVMACAIVSGGNSPIALRVVREREGFSPLSRDWLRAELRSAIERRNVLFAGRDAYRLVHAEADGLPGLFVDRYADAAVIQSATRAMDRKEPEIIAILHELLPELRRIAIRNDGSVRDMESLSRRAELVFGRERGSLVQYHEGQLEFEADLLVDGKTGSYLDQVDNHLIAGSLADPAGDALDICTYHGGFALALARRAKTVLACDQNPDAIARGRANGERNKLSNIDWVCENAFDLMRRLDSERRQFATIVVDPPAFAKRSSGVDAAARGYFELNLRAIRMLSPGGILVTCSCSAKMTSELFGDVLVKAAGDAKREVQILERRGAGADHPVLMGVPETEYLKTWILRAL